jgi:hypothetical protein
VQIGATEGQNLKFVPENSPINIPSHRHSLPILRLQSLAWISPERQVSLVRIIAERRTPAVTW